MFDRFMDELASAWIARTIKPVPLPDLQLQDAPLHFLITGGTGFIGSRLCLALLKAGQVVTVLTRNKDNSAKQLPKEIDCIEKLTPNKNYDVIINLAGESLTSGRWTEKKKQALYASRLNTTQTLIDYIHQSDIKPRLLLSGSAIGYYGTSTTTTFIEESNPVDKDLPHDLCAQWEELALQATREGVRVCLLRTGLVMGLGGVLLKLFTSFKLGLGGKMGDGQQWMSWIHIDDWIKMICFIINRSEINGAVNMTAPYPVTNETFTKTLGAVLHRPTVCGLPAFVLKLIFGEMAEAILLKGQKVYPQKMIDAGYQFCYENIDSALKKLLIAK